MDMKKILKKMDIRVHPDPAMAKRFDKSCGRRYINMGIQTISFFNGIADKINDNELREQAKVIEIAIYKKDNNAFEIGKTLFTNRMKELGLWTSVKGMSAYQKMQVIRKFKKIVKKEGLDKQAK